MAHFSSNIWLAGYKHHHQHFNHILSLLTTAQNASFYGFCNRLRLSCNNFSVFIDSELTPSWLQVDSGLTLGRLWVDSGLTLGWLWVDSGLTLDWLWVDSGLTLGWLCVSICGLCAFKFMVESNIGIHEVYVFRGES